MNKKRRKALDVILTRMLSSQDELRALAEQEREAFDNMSEGLQQSENGQRIDEAATALEEAADSLDSLIDNIQDAMGEG